ncbi:hypothetical protein ES708_01400 [subsurface metagenome]
MLELKEYTKSDLKAIFGKKKLYGWDTTNKKGKITHHHGYYELYPILENNDVFRWITTKMDKFAQKQNKEPKDFKITSYLNALQQYCNYNKVSNPSELLKENIDKRNKRVVDYLVYLIKVEKKNEVSVKNAYQSRIKSFYSARGSPITDGLETEDNGINENEMNLDRDKIQVILNMINNSNYKLASKVQALLGLRIGDVLKELPKYKILKHSEHFYVKNFLTIKENVKIKYLFFPNELTKLLQAIFSIENLRELDLNSNFLKTRKGKMILQSEYLRKLKNVASKLYPNEKMRTHSFRKYFATQISRVNLTKIRDDIGSDVESNFKEHLLGHKVHYSSKVYNQILNDINQFYELWKPLEVSLCIDCEIINTTNEDILKLKEDKAELEEQLKAVQLDNREVKRVLLELFAKVYEIEDLNDLEELKVNRSYDSDKTEKELKEYNERENRTIQYLLQIKRDLE